MTLDLFCVDISKKTFNKKQYTSSSSSARGTIEKGSSIINIVLLVVVVEVEVVLVL